MFQPATFLKIIQPGGQLLSEFRARRSQRRDRTAGVRGRCCRLDGNQSFADHLLPGPEQAGLVLLPSSLVTLVALPISGFATDRFGPKWSIFIGLVALGIASYLLSGLTLTTPTRLIQLWLIGRSIGIGFASQPASVIALSDVPRAKLARGSSFFTLQRQVASAFITSFLATYVKNRTIPHYAHLAEQTTQASPLYTYMSGVVGQAAAQGRWTLPVQAQVLRQVAIQLRLQATVLAFRDALMLITGLIIVAFVLAFFVGNPRASGAGAEITE